MRNSAIWLGFQRKIEPSSRLNLAPPPTMQSSPMKTQRALRKTARTGFTLLELLIVLGIIAAIAAMVAPNLLGSQRRAQVKATRASISGLEQALKMYAADHDGNYPDGSDEVIELLLATEDEDGEAIDPYLERQPLDAWGELLHYEYPNKKSNSVKPAIWSSGPDRSNEQGDGDDVSNWEEDK